MMQRTGTYGFCLLLAALLVGSSTSSAWAYLDPGTGSIILQVVLGGVAGLLLAGKLYWHRLLVTFGLRRDVDDSQPSTMQQDADAAARK
jgi:hypothetical protein